MSFPVPLPPTNPPATLAPTLAPTVACFDADNGAVDRYNDGCDYYASESFYVRYEAASPLCEGRYDDADFSVATMCCACGGGGAEVASTPAPINSSPTRPPTRPPPPTARFRGCGSANCRDTTCTFVCDLPAGFYCDPDDANGFCQCVGHSGLSSS